jgi:predicted DNA-binding protein with PD1-like motif
MGVFTVIGSTMSAILGIYDPTQQVWVTHVEEKATEIVSCLGNVTRLDGSHHVTAKIILADHAGKVTAGHLISKTIVAQAEIMIQEVLGNPVTRKHNFETGLTLIDPKD